MQQFSLFNAPDILNVTEFLGNVNLLFSEMGVVKIKGEICNISLRQSYGFFSLKESNQGVDAEAMVGCFVGWKYMNKVQHLLENGMEVVITGYPSIYVKNGSFRVDIVGMEPVGEGALQKAFEALKLKLSQKGYFEPERKRTIPDFVNHIGIITSMSGAAVIDFQKNLEPQGLQIEYLDVRVEGDSAEESIVRAIKKFNEVRPHLDALVLMRGGGSYESLKAFNSEAVADAIYFSRIPVITGIGHERDDTIADFVADVRCSTPTAVAALLQTKRENLLLQLSTLENNLVYIFDGVFEEQKLILEHETHKLIQNFEMVLQRDETAVHNLEYGLQSGLQYIFNQFNTLKQKFDHAAFEFDCALRLMNEKTTTLSEKLFLQYEEKMVRTNTSLDSFEKQIFALNPEAILERGYSIAYNEKGKVVKSVKNVAAGDMLNLRVSDGMIKTKAV